MNISAGRRGPESRSPGRRSPWCLNLARSPALPGPTWLTVPSPGSASACCSSPRPGRHRRWRLASAAGLDRRPRPRYRHAVPAIVSARRHGRVPWGPALAWGAAAGVLGGAANLLFLLATGSGSLAVTAVLTALYPAVTVALAVLLLHERLSVVRGLGLLLAGIAVTAIVLG